MAEDLGISIGTLRKALADLTEKGLLERIQGSGNYIRQGGTQESVYAMFRLELLVGWRFAARRHSGPLSGWPKPEDLPAIRHQL